MNCFTCRYWEPECEIEEYPAQGWGNCMAAENDHPERVQGIPDQRSGMVAYTMLSLVEEARIVPANLRTYHAFGCKAYREHP